MSYHGLMTEFDDLLAKLGALLEDVEGLDEPVRGPVFAFLHALEAVHRIGMQRFADLIGEDDTERAREADPVVAWLLEAYGVGVDERAEVESALEEVRPYIASHGGSLDVLEVAGGVVRVRLAGSCSGCSGSAVTLTEGVERALRDNYPGFVALQVEEDHAVEVHPPPGATLLPIQDRRA